MTWLLGLKAFAARVPWQLWAALAAVVLVWLGLRWHDARVADLKKQVRADTIAEIREQVRVVRERAEQEKRLIDNRVVELNEEVRGLYAKNRDAIRDRAAALRLRDQAQANRGRTVAAGAVPGVPGGAAGNARAAEGDGLPRQAAIDLLEQCDLNTANLVSWQGWYRAQARAHQEWLQRSLASAPGEPPK